MMIASKTVTTRLSATIAVVLATATLLGLVGRIRADESDPRSLVQAKRHLSTIGIEILKHQDEQGRKALPAAIRGKDGQPLLSWRVAILPSLGEEKLYKQFKLDEPWDSRANKPLLEKMPAVYAPFGPIEGAPHSTYFQVVVGPGTLFEAGSKHTFDAIPDGGASTIVVIEAAEAVPWTKPADLVYDPDKPLPRVGGHFEDGSLTLFADGSVAFIKKDIDEPTLRALMTCDGAETVARRTLRNHVVPIRR